MNNNHLLFLLQAALPPAADHVVGGLPDRLLLLLHHRQVAVFVGEPSWPWLPLAQGGPAIDLLKLGLTPSTLGS